MTNVTNSEVKLPQISEDGFMKNFASRTVLATARFFADEEIEDVLQYLSNCPKKTTRGGELNKKIRTFLKDLNRLNIVSERRNKELTGERIAKIGVKYVGSI